jgi:hypothetical protein
MLFGSSLSYGPTDFESWTTWIALSRTTTSGFVYFIGFTSFPCGICSQTRTLFACEQLAIPNVIPSLGLIPQAKEPGRRGPGSAPAFAYSSDW